MERGNKEQNVKTKEEEDDDDALALVSDNDDDDADDGSSSSSSFSSNNNTLRRNLLSVVNEEADDEDITTSLSIDPSMETYILPINDSVEGSHQAYHTTKGAAANPNNDNSAGSMILDDDFLFGQSTVRTLADQRSLLDEIREVMAQSYLIFLIADLRLMSGTGQICTMYEQLAIDSDLYPRNTAAQLACMVSPSSMSTGEEEEEEKTEEGSSSKAAQQQQQQQPLAPKTLVAKGPDKPSKSLSPANIMTILMLEIRDTVHNYAAKQVYDSGKDEPIDVQETLVSYREDKKRTRSIEDSMTTLLRAYSRMISQDLVTETPTIRRRKLTTSVAGMGMSLVSPRGRIGSNGTADESRKSVDRQQMPSSLGSIHEGKVADFNNSTVDGGVAAAADDQSETGEGKEPTTTRQDSGSPSPDDENNPPPKHHDAGGTPRRRTHERSFTVS